ncbi:PinR Site-specific recombinases, DNA invertase Pin homologs [uncultured Caudovirales phage]|uniref:PinR Site-specific recombinases, DNA invertase Pin homologs n=1 Tax=uncultured Caudovirales phage TaxID=2100421 RepID=A0A6J5LLK2_9CAUD|nr:PinR Site-specific recombinases, DNA invertase Pin homologs [uncultured Caudovirales phage]
MEQGQKIGYKRVSTYEQNPDSQLNGVDLDKVFTDIQTGYSTKNRHELQNLKEYVREGDTVLVECMDRLGRNGYDLDEIVEFLIKKGVQLHFVREGIVLGKKNDLMSKLAYDMMKSFIHFFSRLAKERQRIGIEKAKKEGKYKGRETKLTFDMKLKIEEFLKTRETKSKIARELGISRFSLYRYIEQMQPAATEELKCRIQA